MLAVMIFEKLREVSLTSVEIREVKALGIITLHEFWGRKEVLGEEREQQVNRDLLL